MSSWVIFALIAACALGYTEYLTKKASRSFDVFSLSWARNILALPVFFGLLAYYGLPEVDPTFWKLLLISVPLEVLVGYTFFKAITLTPLSLVLPMTTFSTLFIALGAFFINGEPLKPIYFVGFALILAGAYFIQEKRKISWKTLHEPSSELGIALMIFSTIIFGVAVPIGDRMVAASSEFMYLSVQFGLFIVLFTPIFLMKTSNKLVDFKRNASSLVAVGFFNGVFLATLWIAFSSGPAAPIAAITNLSVLIAVLLAGTLLKEQGLVRRLSATAVMVLGAATAALG